MRCERVLYAAVLLSAAACFPAAARAQFAANASATNSTYAVSGADLVNGGVASYAGTIDGIPNGTGGTLANDGANVGPTLSSTIYSYFHLGGVLTYYLNTNAATGGSPTGYTVTGLNSIADYESALYTAAEKQGNQNSVNQTFDVYLATTANPAFTKVDASPYAYAGGGTGQSEVSLTGGTYANVTGVRLVYGQPSNGQDNSIREVDVFGSPTIGGPIAAGPSVPALSSGPRILTLGDSITQGYPAVAGGYRKELHVKLKADGFAHQFVGTQTSNPSPELLADNQYFHAGNGYDIGHNTALIDAQMAATHPDDVLIHLGINDLRTGSTAAQADGAMNTLLGKIFTDSPKTHVLLAGIIRDNSAFSNVVNGTSTVIQYNQGLQSLVTQYKQQGRAIDYVDMYSHFVDANGAELSQYYGDGVHPNQTGYNLMGDVWASAVEASTPEPGSVLGLLAAGSVFLLRRR